jgi:hypothetical protein
VKSVRVFNAECSAYESVTAIYLYGKLAVVVPLVADLEIADLEIAE